MPDFFIALIDIFADAFAAATPLFSLFAIFPLSLPLARLLLLPPLHDC